MRPLSACPARAEILTCGQTSRDAAPAPHDSTVSGQDLIIGLTSSGAQLVAGIRREPPDWPVLPGGLSPEENLEEGLRVMTAMTGATAPDVVLINSNLW